MNALLKKEIDCIQNDKKITYWKTITIIKQEKLILKE